MNTQKNQKGFTLIELIVVIAIMGIIGAALVPQFATMSLRAKMSTDVSTIKTAQGQVEVYYQEKEDWPGGTGATVDQVVNSLVKGSYLDSRYLKNNSIYLQTPDAKVTWNESEHKLGLSVKADDFAKYNKDTDKEQGWITDGASH